MDLSADELMLTERPVAEIRPGVCGDSRVDAGTSGSAAVCTLFERDHHFGVGALTNSLHASGYRGVIYAGFRGELPGWANPLYKHDGYQEYQVSDGCSIRFIELDTPIHLANYRPTFMLQLWNRFCPDADKLYYYDPDIVITCPWSFYETWVDHGAALCEDGCKCHMPADHPVRLAWLDVIHRADLVCRRRLDQYFNIGFLGLRKDCSHLLDVWLRLLSVAGECGADLTTGGDFSMPFYATDENMLNAAVMATAVPLSTIGPEGMGFRPGGFTMLHAVGTPKPWRKRMTAQALKGCPPGLADKGYWQHTKSPIRLYSDATRMLKLLDLKCAAAIGRVLRRA
jgi:hypothetical protein